MWTWNLQLFSLSDSRTMPSREAQADRNLWHLITWTPKTWSLFCFLAQAASSLLFSLDYFGTKKKEISFIWHAFQDTKGSLNVRKLLFSYYLLLFFCLQVRNVLMGRLPRTLSHHTIIQWLQASKKKSKFSLLNLL